MRSPAETNEGVIFIDRSSAKANKTLSIKYKSAEPKPEWKRTFFMNDANEHTYKEAGLKGQDGTVIFTLKELTKAAEAGKPVFIYTVSLPKDPNLAAVVRVQRYLLCKIQWK